MKKNTPRNIFLITVALLLLGFISIFIINKVNLNSMGFLDKIVSSFAGKKHSADEYVDLGEGLPWFNDYRAKGKPTLSEYFGLNKANRIKIKATIGKTGYYQTEKGKRWAVMARYFDEKQQKEFTFYCPEWEYDPINDYGNGDVLEMYVDKDDYTKYEMPIY